MPKRIQRERTRGWRMPEWAVYVGRPGMWGNPYRVGDEIPGTGGDTYDAESATAMFRRSARSFWDILLEIANGEAQS